MLIQGCIQGDIGQFEGQMYAKMYNLILAGESFFLY